MLYVPERASRKAALAAALVATLEPDSPSPHVDAVEVGGRRLHPTPVFETYWRFAAARQQVYLDRLAGLPGPWTDDPIISAHRFTNCYRATDRVSQYLINHVIYRGSQNPDEVVFRVLLFKFFNRISTWNLLESQLGDLTWEGFDLALTDQILTRAFLRGERLYSAAYVIPPPQLGSERKHSNHLRLLQHMMVDNIADKLRASRSMKHAFSTLRTYPALGNFLAFQFLIDINYSDVVNFDEMAFVVPGPGARDGLQKCFGRASRGVEADLIRYMSESQDEQFARLGLAFPGLRGRRLQLIDCQNLFCEVDKYARVAHPEIAGHSGRTRIKQRFAPLPQSLTSWFPPKWGINGSSGEPR